MSHVSGSLVAKRAKNIWRPAGGFIPSGPTDPFFSQVLFLLPMADAGSALTDYGPNANAVSLLGAAGMLTDQNATQQLFGQNTLEISKAPADDERMYQLERHQQILATDDLVLEWWFRQASGAAFVTSPVHAWLQMIDAGGTLLASLFSGWTSFPTANIQFRASGVTGANQAAALNTWHYMAIQFVAADNAAYCYLDGSQIYSLACNIVLNDGWRHRIITTATGPTANTYHCWLANMRATRANRYGNLLAIPVPTAPWPTS